MTVVSVLINHKGGYAKTTSVGNLGCALAGLARRMLSSIAIATIGASQVR
jgi:cellulose biosynthesis protein BcsQ